MHPHPWPALRLRLAQSAWIIEFMSFLLNCSLLRQCSQYFDLVCQLLGYLDGAYSGINLEWTILLISLMFLPHTVSMQEKLQLDVPRMLDDELDWLSAFVPSENSEAHEIDNLIIAGHLRLIKTLLTCEGVDKKRIGRIPCLLGIVNHIPYFKLVRNVRLYTASLL